MFATLSTNTMAVSSDQCDVTESRVVKSYAIGPYYSVSIIQP